MAEGGGEEDSLLVGGDTGDFFGAGGYGCVVIQGEVRAA